MKCQDPTCWKEPHTPADHAEPPVAVLARIADEQGAPSVTVSRWLDCRTCGQPFYRARSFTGPDREQDAAAWQPEPTCASCVFGFGQAVPA